MLLHCLHFDQSVLALDSSLKRPSVLCTAYSAAREGTGCKRETPIAYLSNSSHKLQGIPFQRLATVGSRLPIASAGVQQLDTQTQDLPLVPTDKERQQDQQRHSNGLEPLDSASASQRLTDLCRGRQYQKAWRLLGQATEQRICPTVQALRSVLVAAVQAGHAQRALQVFHMMQDANMRPSLATWCQVISALSGSRRRGQLLAQEAFSLWTDLQDTGLVLDGKALVVGMHACAVAGHTDEAEALLPQLRSQGSTSALRAGCNVLISAYVREGRLDAAQARYAGMAADGVRPDITSINTLVGGLVHARRLDEAEELVDEAKQAGLALDAYTCSALVQGRLIVSDFTGAWQALADMRTAGVCPSKHTYGLLMDAYASIDDLSGCQRVLESMAADRIVPNAIIWNAFLKARMAMPQNGLEVAGPTLRAMGRAGLAPDTDTINTLMQAALKQGTPGVVPCLFRSLLRAELLPDALSYTNLISAFTVLGRFSDARLAIQLLQRDASVPMDGPALTASIHGLCSGQRFKRAEALLKEYMSAQPGDCVPPTQPFGALIAGYVRASMLDRALEAMREYCRRGGVPDPRMVEDIVPLCLAMGNFRHALQAISMLERSGGKLDKAPLQQAFQDLEERAREGQRKPSGSEHFERFKFWLGLPNAYYTDLYNSLD